MMEDSSWRSALLKRNDLRTKVAAGIEAPNVVSPLLIKTLISEDAVISLAPFDAPSILRANKRKGKSSAVATSSASKKWRTQVSSSYQGAGEDSSTGQSDDLVLDSVANLSPPVEVCRATFPREGIVPLETLYQQMEVDTISVQPYSALVGHFGENMQVVTAILFSL